MLIAIELEQKFSKQRIFEMYANQVYLGQRGSFSINGFGEASHAYFNKDVKNLTLPEAALLAGMIQRPSYLSPYRHPEARAGAPQPGARLDGRDRRHHARAGRPTPRPLR